jgi:hypothetical protein
VVLEAEEEESCDHANEAQGTKLDQVHDDTQLETTSIPLPAEGEEHHALEPSEHRLEDEHDEEGLGAQDHRDVAEGGLDEMDNYSRESSPIPFTDFFEPTRWSQRLMIVQDPFDLTRNTANNVEPDIVEMLRSVSSQTGGALVLSR